MSDHSSGKDSPREFESVTEPAEARQLLWEAAKTTASTMIWTKDHHQSVQTHTSLFDEPNKLLCCAIPQKFDPSAFMDHLAKMGERQCYFSVSLQRANVFFRTDFIGFSNGLLQFRVPETLFKVQRRKDFRFRVPADRHLMIEFQDPLFPENRLSKRILDISAGGAAIIVDTKEQMTFMPGAVLKNAQLSLNGRSVAFEAEIRHIRSYKMPVTGTEAAKVGLLFRGLKASEAQVIASFVFEESRKAFTRFL